VAGVTFLAFGNGSPDVFSTFSAMRAGSGSLAIGELIGAATFIVTVVAGSIAVIRPFKVPKLPFLRDVGFFTVSVSLLLVITQDGTINSWEAISMIILYVFYVLVVVIGSFWERKLERRRTRELTVQQEYTIENLPQVPYRDEGNRILYLHQISLAQSNQKPLSGHFYDMGFQSQHLIYALRI
jgi:solute carrier family 24 (sodium/potassium/calcium exchanger), member 6